ncbi:type IX secretion system sortase PorU [Flavobacterium sp. SUN052]|uniref:type IX secretion system sortase PorU n=1 Tax=Flavobacterium sp. SUN052 TaxID=3002441 RepID=UPI00237E29AD|nr:type IX secretion system sortase PorU [Flavobacterium sp. SUN052]MEC4004587.1 type IX secretion system sortase PorU [Flavobacterium sp. SUN052]
MKKIFTFLFLFICLFVSAQQSGTIVVNWNDKSNYTFGEYKVTIPQFQLENLNYDFSTKSLVFTKKIVSNSIVDENSLQITNITYESIPDSQLGDLDRKVIKSSIGYSLKNIIARNLIFGMISFSPIVKDENGYKKILSFNYSFSATNNASKYIGNQNLTNISISVLATGTWKRFYVQKSGVYKLSKSFLSDLGFNVNSINPTKIKIYGNGGRMVPLANSASYPFDIEENAIQVIGESDGSFDNDDYILFYAEGMDNWSPENETHLNLYADKSYYYINVEGVDGKRISNLVQPSGAATLNLSTFDEYQFHEVDLTNIGKLGRIWFGESFSINSEQTFDFNFPNIVSTSTPKITVHAGANSFAETSFAINVNSQNLGTITLQEVALNSGNEASHGYLNANLISSQNFSVKLTYNNNGVPTSKAYLDYIIIKAKSNLTGFGKQFKFTYDDANSQSGIVNYQLSNATAISQVWDITDIYNVSSAVNSGQSNFSFKSNLGSVKKYIAIDESDFYTPSKDSNPSVANQDLKGTIFNDSNGNFQDIDYLIITPSFLNAQAEKLANFHRSYSNLNVKVVNLDVIYQEFGSGKQDIGAIRNFVKYVYQNASSPSVRVKFLNLFGDASYDFKDRTPNNTNIVPIYHALSSYYSGETSFASDDYFALMDNNEGDPLYAFGADIAVGRMLVSSVQQADEMVNKVFEYHDIKSYGSWRNNYVAISDDADKSSDSSLEIKQNTLTDQIYNQKPFVNYKKILLDSYQQQTSAGGDRYPQAKEDLTNAFEKGALVFDYLGHGGEDGLTSERIWDKFDGFNFNNQYRYPLFITITCDFSRFDNPSRATAGEYTYWNPKGGAISMITTIRTIGQYNAELFNDVLSDKLFSFGSNQYYSIAESLRLAKIASNNNSSTRVVFYLGDPALMLAIPKPKVVLTKVNDVSITQPVDDLKALSYVKLSGEVQDENGTLLSGYSGELSINVFDKNYNKTTFDNDGYSPAMSFSNLGETIFRGNASINNGLFEIGFVVPRDIKIPLGNGRVSFYAKRNQILLDKTGYNLDIKVGGINTNAVADVTPPRVKLYMNDESFVNGGITNESPFFLAFLEDEHGINTASGIGHDIVAILDGDETKPYILNDYYETELNDYTKGKIRFPFRNLAKGLHTITFKAWDVYNNFVSAEIQFVVADSENVTLSNVLNYPNPFVNYTQFWFNHNKPYEPIEVQVQVMTITGKIVKTINQTVTTEGFLSRDITWDGKDDFGDKIGKGVYIYKLTVRSTISNNKAEKIEKLVIL